MIKNIATEWEELQKIEKRANELRSVISDKLAEVVKEKGKSFHQGSKYFQIRMRGGKHYICESDVPFGSWLKKEKKV